MAYKPIVASYAYKPRSSGMKRRRGRYYRKYRKPMAPRRTGGFFSVRQRTIGAEKKTIDQAWTTTAANDALDPWLLNATATGSDFTDRIGRRIKQKSLLINALVNMNAGSSANTPSMTRILVAIDKQWNATATTGGTAGTTPPVATGVGITTILKNSSINSPLNLNNRDRYKVICDKYITVGPGGPNSRHIKIYKKNLNLETTYGGTTYSGGSIQTNAIIIWLVSDRSTASADEPTVVINTRIRFIDM